LSCSGDSM